MKDLELRGGAEQSGYVQIVGFDLYCKMLKGAIESGKGKEMNKKAQRHRGTKKNHNVVYCVINF